MGDFNSSEYLIRSSCAYLERVICNLWEMIQVWEEMIKENGCMETGDIMEQRGPNRLIWIDRKKNILKLSQGEFVSLGRLEATYSGSTPVIDQIYIYGSSLHSHLLAVVVPSEGELICSLCGTLSYYGLRKDSPYSADALPVQSDCNAEFALQLPQLNSREKNSKGN